MAENRKHARTHTHAQEYLCGIRKLFKLINDNNYNIINEHLICVLFQIITKQKSHIKKRFTDCGTFLYFTILF